jgi:hypothetical protein
MITAIQDRLDLDVPTFKTFLKIDHNEEDALLADMLAAAMLQADQYCQNEFKDEAGADLAIPAGVRIAVLRIAAALYESRFDHVSSWTVSGIGMAAGQIEWNAQRLLQPYRKFFAC